MIAKTKKVLKKYRHFSEHDLVIYSHVLKLSVVALWVVFIWFGIIYYPKLHQELMPKGSGSSVVSSAYADFDGFPVETENFDIEHRYGTSNYEVTIKARTVPQFLEVKTESVLFLKNFIGAESLCDFEVTFFSENKLKLKQSHLELSNC